MRDWIHTQLINAINESRLEVVKELLKTEVNINTKNDALQLAVESGCLEIVQELIKAGADVFAIDDVALHIAAYYGYLDIVRELLKAGVDPKVVPNLKILLLKGLK